MLKVGRMLRTALSSLRDRAAKASRPFRLQSTFAEDQIPHGPFCYASLEPMDERGFMRVNGKCPYWESREGQNAYCRYLDCEDEWLLWDQVKICNINDGDPHPSTMVGFCIACDGEGRVNSRWGKFVACPLCGGMK